MIFDDVQCEYLMARWSFVDFPDSRKITKIGMSCAQYCEPSRLLQLATSALMHQQLLLNDVHPAVVSSCCVSGRLDKGRLLWRLW